MRGPNLTLSAKLISASGTPTGAVTFLEDGDQIGSAEIDATGAAILSNTLQAPGLHTLLATYPGQDVFSPAISVKVVVLVGLYGVNLTLASSSNPSILTQPVTFTAKISAEDGIPTGTLTFVDNTYTLLGTVTPDSNGVATLTTSSLALGCHRYQRQLSRKYHSLCCECRCDPGCGQRAPDIHIVELLSKPRQPGPVRHLHRLGHLIVRRANRQRRLHRRKHPTCHRTPQHHNIFSNLHRKFPLRRQPQHHCQLSRNRRLRQ